MIRGRSCGRYGTWKLSRDSRRAWLLSIVRNACLTQLRRRRPDGRKVEFDEALHSPQEESSGREVDLASESLSGGLYQVPAEYREVLVLRELEGLSYK